MQFTEKLLEVRDQLNNMSHDAFVTGFAPAFIGKSDEEKEKIKIEQKTNDDPLREYWDLMQGADAILVLNYDKHGIKNYIGGNTLMEMGFAHILTQKIFLFNPIPEIPYYKTEIESVKPIIINGDLSKIKLDCKKIKLGKYQHYKGNFYKVIHLSHHSNTLEDYIVYKALYDSKDFGENAIWVKSVSEFCKKVIVDGKEVPRFSFVENN